MSSSAARASRRVLPSLLDRLTTPDPSEISTGGRGPSQGVGSDWIREGEFHDTVLRDLEWLFNGSGPFNQEGAEFRARHPHISASVLNYGLRNIFGKFPDDIGQLQVEIATALENYEPRLKVDSQRLELSKEGQVVRVVIQGTIITKRSTRKLVVSTNLETLSSKLSLDFHG